MINYSPASQLTFDDFDHPFERSLNPDNRWVKLSEQIPWDELAGGYAKSLKGNSGRQSVDIRLVIAAIIIKHKLKLSDREAVSTISENIYLQYFCGYRSFRVEEPFDASLFVDLRKRMGSMVFDQFNIAVIAKAEQLQPKRKAVPVDREAVAEADRLEARRKKCRDAQEGCSNADESEQGEQPPNKGTLKIDATVADQQIAYPTDIDLLNTCRLESERIIDGLYKKAVKLGLYKGDKPRTYRRNARKDYLNISKKKNKSKKALHKAIGKQVRYVKRNRAIIEKLLDLLGTQATRWPLSFRDQRIYWVLQHCHQQQTTMYQNKERSHPNRIVSIYQPNVRPIVRGKSKAKVEFGAKLNVSECNGMTTLDTISWEAYNESTDLVKQVKGFKKIHGCFPELVLADGIYMTRKNRNFMKDNGIRSVAKPLGRPPKEDLTAAQKRKRKKERNQRNHVEGKFGQGKNGYALNCIKARRQDTSESWISAIFFVMNLVKLQKLAGKRLFAFINELKHAFRSEWGWIFGLSTANFRLNGSAALG
jgi:hypothetical protein